MNLFDAAAGRTKRMNHVDRYSTFPIIRKENVAEHSWWVSFISLLIVEDLQHRGLIINMETVLRRAVCHDLSEVISGDIIRSYKHTNPEIKAAMDAADRINMKSLAREYGSASALVFNTWCNAKGDKTMPEDICGDVVAFADLSCVAFYCRSEWLLGNKEVEPILEDMYDSWFHDFHQHEWLGLYAGQMFPTKTWSDMLSFRHGDLLSGWPGQSSPIMPNRTEGAVTEHDWPHSEEAIS